MTVVRAHCTSRQWFSHARTLPPTQADSIWCDSGSENPGPGGRLLIRRLELEAQLAAKGHVPYEPPRALPPLELPIMSAARPSPSPAKGQGAGGYGNGASPSPSPRVGQVLVHIGGGGGAAGVPEGFLCPLSQRVMTDPVVTPGECGVKLFGMEQCVEWERVPGGFCAR